MPGEEDQHEQQQPLHAREHALEGELARQVDVAPQAAHLLALEDRQLADDLLGAVAAAEPHRRDQAEEQPEPEVVGHPGDQQPDQGHLGEQERDVEPVGEQDLPLPPQQGDEPPGGRHPRHPGRRGRRPPRLARRLGHPGPSLPEPPFPLLGRGAAAQHLGVDLLQRRLQRAARGAGLAAAARVAAGQEVFARLLRVAVEDQPPAVHEQQPVEQVGLLQHVGGAHHRQVGQRQRLEQLHQRLLGRRVEARRRLVEEQHRGLGQQLDADAHALALPAREVHHPLVGVLAEPEHLDRALDQRLALGARQLEPQPGAEPERVAHDQLVVDDVVLRHEPDRAGPRAGQLGVRHAADVDPALVGRADPAQRVEQGALPLSGAAEDADELAGADRHRDPVEDPDRLAGHPVGDAHHQLARVDRALRRAVDPPQLVAAELEHEVADPEAVAEDQALLDERAAVQLGARLAQVLEHPRPGAPLDPRVLLGHRGVVRVEPDPHHPGGPLGRLAAAADLVHPPRLEPHRGELAPFQQRRRPAALEVDAGAPGEEAVLVVQVAQAGGLAAAVVEPVAPAARAREPLEGDHRGAGRRAVHQREGAAGQAGQIGRLPRQGPFPPLIAQQDRDLALHRSGVATGRTAAGCSTA